MSFCVKTSVFHLMILTSWFISLIVFKLDEKARWETFKQLRDVCKIA